MTILDQVRKIAKLEADSLAATGEERFDLMRQAVALAGHIDHEQLLAVLEAAQDMHRAADSVEAHEGAIDVLYAAVDDFDAAMKGSEK